MLGEVLAHPPLDTVDWLEVSRQRLFASCVQCAILLHRNSAVIAQPTAWAKPKKEYTQIISISFTTLLLM